MIGWIRRHRASLLIGFGLFVLAVALRGYHLATSFDVFVDEITYLRLGERMAHHLDVELYGDPFYLHPPAFFVLEAVHLLLVRPAGSVIEAVWSLRWVNVILAGISTVLMWQLVRRLAGSAAGLVAAGLFVLDPFVIRINSRVLLETSAMMWILAGFVSLLPVLEREDDGRLNADTWPSAFRSVTTGAVPVRALLAGLFFGLALLTKDPTAFLSVAPFLAAAAIPTVQRRTALATIATTALVYAPYPIVVALAGDWRTFVQEKGVGVLRLLGEVQLTGFNRPGSISFVERVIDRLDTFAATYALIGLGALAALGLMVRGGRSRRLLAVWGFSTYALAAYTVVRGTLEEQLFYYLVVPSIVVSSIALGDLWNSDRAAVRRASIAGAAVAVVGFAVFASVAWVQTHTQDDAAFARLVRHLEQEVPPDVLIGTTSDVAQFAIDTHPTFPIRDLDDLRRTSPSYVVLSTKSVKDGTVDATDELVDWIRQHGEVRYSARGDSVGELLLLDLSEAPRISA